MKHCILLIIIILSSIFTFAQGDWTIAALTPLEYQVPGKREFKVTIKNAASSGIGSYSIFWQIDNGPVKSVTKTAFATQWSGAVGLASDTAFNFNFSSNGVHTLKAWIANTIPADVNPSNDTMTETINVVSELPKKNVVLEVFKHQGCGPCYNAANYTDTFIAKNPTYSIAQIYCVTSDPLYNADGTVVDDHYSFPHPMPVFDRYKFPFESKIGTQFYSDPTGYHLRSYGERDLYYEPVEVFFESVTYNKNTRQLDVKVGATFYDNLNGDYRFNFYITEDSIQSYQASAPNPNNYYHKYVLRAMLGGPWGQAGSLPSTLKKFDTKYYNFSYTIPAGYNTDKMKFIAIVQQYNNDDMKRRILNSVHMKFNDAVSVKNIAHSKTNVSVYPNPTTDFITVSVENTISKRFNVRIADISGKTLKNIDSNGNSKIDVKDLPAGTYLMYIDDGKIVHTEKFVKE